MDSIKSGCEKSWAEVQVDSFQCRGCDEGTRGGVETAEAARCGNGGLCQWLWWGDSKVGEDDEREMLGRAHLSLGGG